MKKTNILGITVNFFEDLEDWQILKVVNSYKLKNYIVKNISNKDIEILAIDIFKVNFFGKEVGFIYLESKIYFQGNRIPGIAFLRGDAVGVFLVLNTINEEGYKEQYSLCVEQYRHSIGKSILDVPAGMIDNEGEIISTAIKEIEEEIGDLNINVNDLKLIQEFYSSEGACDEKYSLYRYEMDIEHNKLMEFQNKITGSKEENEFIQVKVVKLSEIKNFQDSIKLQLGYMNYMEEIATVNPNRLLD